ncbi:MAG: sigma-70 family RNA polymerase sigma factor [Pseudarthrobacter sp.]|nr:sigma-70 family RNA polymerase sigma factor [Pseudarthrobacter sp.]
MQGTRHEAVLPGQTDDGYFSAAYRELSPGVLSYLRSRNVEDPEGLTQEVFLALYPKLGEVSGGLKGVKSLAFSIAHARYVDEHRRRLKAPPTTGYDPAADSRCSDSAEDELLAVESSASVASLLNALQRDQQEVIALRVVADLSVEATAEIMGRSPGAVKQLQRRALCRLRKLIPSWREGQT